MARILSLASLMKTVLAAFAMMTFIMCVSAGTSSLVPRAVVGAFAASASEEDKPEGFALIRSSAQWRLLSAPKEGSGRLVLYTISESSLCPQCGAAEVLVRRFAEAQGATHQTVIVMCDAVGPSADPCRGVTSFPHIAGYTMNVGQAEELRRRKVSSSDADNDDTDDDEDDVEVTIAAPAPAETLDLTTSPTVDLTRIAAWVMSLDNTEAYAERIGEWIAKAQMVEAEAAELKASSGGDEPSSSSSSSSLSSGSSSVYYTPIPLHGYTPLVKPVTAKELEAEVRKFDVALVLVGGPSCPKCADPLQSLEKLGKLLLSNADALGATTVALRRVVVDSNLRNEFGLSDATDVPILLAWSKKAMCGGDDSDASDDSSASLTSNGRWARCAPTIYYGSTHYGDLLRYIQREFGVSDEIKASLVEGGDTSDSFPRIDTPLTSQLKSLAAQQKDAKKSPNAHGIATIFGRHSTVKAATTFLDACRQKATKGSGGGCLVQMVSTWYMPLFPLLQQQVNVFVGASILAKGSAATDAVQFAMVDVAAVPSAVLDVIAGALGASAAADTATSVSSFCPNAVCVYAIGGRSASSSAAPRMLPTPISIDDFNAMFDVAEAKPNGPTQLLTRGSRFYRVVAGEVAASEALPYPAKTNFVRGLEEARNHVLIAYTPRLATGARASAFRNQFAVRQLIAFEAMCQSLNATNDLNGGEGEVRCVAIDANRNAQQHRHGDDLPTLPSLISARPSEALLDVAAAVGAPHLTYFESALAALRSPSLFEQGLCKKVNMTCRQPKYAKVLKAGAFEQTVNDPELFKFVLFGGGASCPHTPLLMSALERVARVHNQRDRHEISVAFIDATTELTPELKQLYGIDTTPQMRFYPRGTRAQTNGVQRGERYMGPTIAESIFDFIHFEMGYGYVDLDYRKETSITAVTGRDFADRFVNDMAANQSHTVLFLYDSVLGDRFTLDTLFALDRTHFNNPNATTRVSNTIEFCKMDGRQFAKLVTKHHLVGLATTHQLPQLVFLPKGSNKLRKVELYDVQKHHQRFAAVSVADFILKTYARLEGIADMPAATALFNFSKAELREQQMVEEDKPSPVGAKVTKSLSMDTFKEFVAERGDRVVLFYTTTCSYCAAYRPLFDGAAAHFAGDQSIAFGAINLEVDAEVGHMQGIQTIPSVKVYFDGSVDKTTDFRGEDFVGAKNGSEPLIQYILSVRGSPRVGELDQLRALRDVAIPTYENTKAFDAMSGVDLDEDAIDFDFEPSVELLSTPNAVVSVFDDKTYTAPLLLEVAMEFCGHCYHLNNVLISLDNYFRESPLPRPAAVPQADAHLQFRKIDGSLHTSVATRYGIEEFPTLILFFTEVMANGTMRHKSVKYNGNRNNNAIGEFLVKHLHNAVAPSLAAPRRRAQDEEEEVVGQAPPEMTPASDASANPFEEEAIHQQRLAEEEEENAVFNESIPVFSPRLVRTALLRTSAVVIMTYSLPRDQPFVLVMNELHRVLSNMEVVKKGMLATAIYPEHLITDEIAQLTGWSKAAGKPFISLFRGMVQPQVVNFNRASMAGVGDAPPPGAEDLFYDQPTPNLILQFLDQYAQNMFVLPRSLNETTFMENMRNLSSPSGTLRRWAVLLTSYDCKLCRKMIDSTSYSAQAQMILHDRTVETTVLDINRARRIYKQWGSPKLPALVVFEKPMAHVGDGDGEDEGKPLEVTHGRVLKIPDYEEGEEDLVVPKRRQVHEFILGEGDHPYDVIKPAMSFRINAKALVAKAERRVRAEGIEAVKAALAERLVTVGSASDLEHALRKLSAPALVVVRGDICSSCARIEAAALKMLTAATAAATTTTSPGDLPALKALSVIGVQLPKRSRNMERELITMGFAQLSSPSVYLVTKNASTGKKQMLKFAGNKEDAVSLFDFILENTRN